MSTTTDTVGARIDNFKKEVVTKNLKLTVSSTSEAIRLLVVLVANEVKVPNKVTTYIQRNNIVMYWRLFK